VVESTHPQREASSRQLTALVLALAVTSAACSATVKPREAAVFFPPAPALPRIQYLTYYTGQKDIETQSSFNRFVVGERQSRDLDKPYGVAAHDGKIYVCDTNATVSVFDLKQRTFSFLKGATGNGVLRQPVNISITPDGIKYVSDPVRGQVVAYDANDEYLKAYGTPGQWKPVDAVAFGDRLYVADVEHGAVVALDRGSGQKVASIGDKGEPASRLNRPTNIAFDTAGTLYVTDIGRFQIVKFDHDGRLAGTIGKLGDGPGHFARPKGVAVDRQGLVYAVDAAFSNVQIFTADGHVATFFGGPGTNPGTLTLPAKVSIDYDDVAYFRSFAAPGFDLEYLVLVTSQFGDRRINVFGYGREHGKQYPTEEELLRETEAKRAKQAQAAPPAAPSAESR